MLQRAGMNVEYAGLDFGVVLQRQLKKDPVGQGGWSAGVGNWQGIDWHQSGWQFESARR
jgi:peptide/nickel transport system substrate-binding protein